MHTILIDDGIVLTADGWANPGYVWIVGERIAAVGAGEAPADLAAQAEEIISARHCAVMPGLVNAHTHLSQTFMRGLAGGRPLLPWLRELIWPLQGALTPQDLHLAALLGLVENLTCGVTRVVNHHKVAPTHAHTDAVCEAALTAGLRVTLARSWTDLGSNAEPADAILSDLQRLFGQWQGSERLTIANGPLALWRCSTGMLQRSHELAQKYGSFTHFHVSESQDEVKMSLDQSGQRPVTWLDAIGVLGPDTQVVHAVWVDESEIELLAERGAPVIHCPVSNAILGSGIAPLAELLSSNIAVHLGTDGPASNDTQDIWETVKTAVNLARARALDATALPPAVALRLAMGETALIPGSAADLILVDLNHPRAMPVHDVDSALALSTHGSDVDTVIAGGQILMRKRRVLPVDVPALLEACRYAVKDLRQRAGIDNTA